MKPKSSSQYTLKSHSVKPNTYSGLLSFFFKALSKLEV